MNDPKWTKGPWAVNPLRAQVDAMPSLVPICQMLWPTPKRSEGETEANARLIASAPELFEALALFVKYDDTEPTDGLNPMYNYNAAIDAARRAIAKATGATP